MVKIFPFGKHNHLFLRRLVLIYPSAFRYCVFSIMLNISLLREAGNINYDVLSTED